eukprot:6768490-Pyramimonas_sp.AAC.1
MPPSFVGLICTPNVLYFGSTVLYLPGHDRLVKAECPGAEDRLGHLLVVALAVAVLLLRIVDDVRLVREERVQLRAQPAGVRAALAVEDGA